LDLRLDEDALGVAGGLLDGATDDAVVARLEGAHSRASLVSTVEALRGSSLLRPLFAT
jgi:hypothetical protein